MDKRYLPAYLTVCRALLIYGLTVCIYLLSSLAIGTAWLGGCLFLLVLVFHSTVRVFAQTTPRLRDAALYYCEEYAPHERRMKTILGAIFADRLSLLESAVLLALPLLLPLEFGLYRFAVPFISRGVPRILAKLIVVHLLWLLFVPMGVLSHYYAFLWWMEHRRKETLRPIPARCFKLLGVTALYLVCGVLLYFFLPVCLSAYYITVAIFEVGWYLPFLIFGGIILAVFGTRFLRARRIRRRFFKNLKETASACGATLSPIRHPYRSLLRIDHEPSFTVTRNGKHYDCLLLGALKRRNPLFFSETGKVQCLHSFRFRRVEFFRYTTEYDCSFASTGTKCIIVVPVSHEIYAGHTGFFRLIDTGECVGDYHIHTATGFLGALSRDVLDRRA